MLAIDFVEVQRLAVRIEVRNERQQSPRRNGLVEERFLLQTNADSLICGAAKRFRRQ